MTTRKAARLALIPIILASLAFFTPAIAPVDAVAADRSTRHALIIGVSEYPSLEGKDLFGPANDAELVADVLTNWGFERADIRIVADKVDGAELPTRAAIIGAMEDLIDEVREGDFVYVHFSGHGSRQPVVSRGNGASEESDNFDEIFLPRDTSYWGGGAEPIENAIVDDEINYFVTSLRNKGAFVWIVFDSCHSGDMTRSIEPDGELSREIDFMELVRPEDRDAALAALEQAEAGQVRSRGAGEPEHSFSGDEAALDDDAAGYVAFFAAQTTEETPEMRLPRGVRPRQAHGMFTFTLMNLVQTNPGLTYRQLGQQVMLSYEAMHRTRPTPLFVGSGLDASVFGVAAGERVEQYRVRVENGLATLPAGSLHNVTSGTILAVVPQPGADMADAIGYLEVTSAQLSESRAVPIEFEDFEPLDMESIPDAAYARPVQRSISLRMAVALPESESVAESIVETVASDEDGLENMIEWVGTREPADLRLLAEDGNVWFLPPSGELCTRDILRSGQDSACSADTDITPSVRLSSRSGSEELVDNLRAVARATNLMNVARTTYSGGSADVVLSMDVRRRDESDFATVGGPIMDLGEYCNRRFREGEEFVTVSAGTRPQLRPGDCVRFRIENRSSRAQDVTVLFMDSRWGIDSYFPMMSGDQNRIEAGGERYIAENSAGFLVTPTTTGVERMLMIAVPGSGGLLADFSYLAQPQLTATRSLGEGSELHDLLDQAGFRGESTRGLAQGTQESTTTQVLSWVTESD